MTSCGFLLLCKGCSTPVATCVSCGVPCATLLRTWASCLTRALRGCDVPWAWVRPHPPCSSMCTLVSLAQLHLCHAVSSCVGGAVEHLLIKYGRNIIDEQFLLIRLAYSAIDVYAMVAVLSRASRALEKSLPSAEHEALLAQLICSEATGGAVPLNPLGV
ncbi:hypothetical protein MRX96_022357 [Rhipicephalus microplus]